MKLLNIRDAEYDVVMRSVRLSVFGIFVEMH